MFLLLSDTIEISEFNDWVKDYGDGRLLVAMKRVLDKHLSSQPSPLVIIPAGRASVAAIASSLADTSASSAISAHVTAVEQPCSSSLAKDSLSVESLAAWLTPVDPESDLAKRMHMQPNLMLKYATTFSTLMCFHLYADKSSYAEFGKGTRIWFLKEVKQWMDDEKTEERAFLLRGGAGLGKSVMAGVSCGY